MEQKRPDITDEEISKALKSSRSVGLCCTILAGVGILIAIIGAVTSMIPMIIVGVVIAGIGGIIKGKSGGTARGRVNDTIVRGVLDEVFENPECDFSGHLSSKHVYGSGLSLPGFANVGGGSYVRARYKGMEVELSNVTLTEISEFQNEDSGMWEQHEDTVYVGQWLVCSSGGEMPVDLKIYPRDAVDKLLKRSSVKTGNEEFDKRFTVSADSETAALGFLAPSVIEGILSASGTFGGKLSISILRDGTVYIAVKSGRGFFDIGRGDTDAARLRIKFKEELLKFTGLLDVLCRGHMS